jgi:hypothetical protein
VALSVDQVDQVVVVETDKLLVDQEHLVKEMLVV